MLGKVKEWKSSGLSRGGFAKKNGFSKTGFDYWVKKSVKLNDFKAVSFVELSPTNKPHKVEEISLSSPEPALGQGSIVITFACGMTVKIIG